MIAQEVATAEKMCLPKPSCQKSYMGELRQTNTRRQTFNPNWTSIATKPTYTSLFNQYGRCSVTQHRDASERL
jgi:hypothetical protein